MKFVVSYFALFFTLSAMAAPSPGIICRDDRRSNNGPLRELILTPAGEGYVLQSQFVPSLDSTDIKIETWAEKLTCRIEADLAFCKNTNGQIVAQFKERREVYLDTLEADAKKKSSKHIDISVNENGVETKATNFAASHCQAFGGEA